MAELVKAAVIGDTALFAALESAAPRLREHLAGGERRAVAPELLEALPWRAWIGAAVRVKEAIVARDPRERGPRAALNLGHTLAHVLEATGATGSVPTHGEAVAVGMVAAFRIAVARGLCAAADRQRVARLLAACGLPTTWQQPPPQVVAALLRGDKKARDGEVRWVLPTGIGSVVTGQRVQSADAWQALDAGPEESAAGG
jgi:3-dehydroquinate synthase